jgi:hypothetical protein
MVEIGLSFPRLQQFSRIYRIPGAATLNPRMLDDERIDERIKAQRLFLVRRSPIHLSALVEDEVADQVLQAGITRPSENFSIRSEGSAQKEMMTSLVHK